jgi:hypothetical protein
MKATIAAVRSALRLLEDRGGEPELCAALAAGLERIDEQGLVIKRLVGVCRHFAVAIAAGGHGTLAAEFIDALDAFDSA